jgi:zinc D-Ala-D-Ala dipeptidase
MRIAKTCVAVLCLSACAHAPMPQAPLPTGFVRLAEVAPTIRQDMRYASRVNFMGRRIEGYQAPVCIVTWPTAAALARAQAAVAQQGLTLVMFDCYRPARAVADFMAWTQIPGPADRVWRPNVAKDRLVPEGYIAARSGHSRGSTVDIGLARLQPNSTDKVPRKSPCARADVATLDFGTPFDCFDPASATAFAGISTDARANRDTLLKAMTDSGFRNYSAEWWHFTLIDEPFKTDIFDFSVTAH